MAMPIEIKKELALYLVEAFNLECTIEANPNHFQKPVVLKISNTTEKGIITLSLNDEWPSNRRLMVNATYPKNLKGDSMGGLEIGLSPDRPIAKLIADIDRRLWKPIVRGLPAMNHKLQAENNEFLERQKKDKALKDQLTKFNWRASDTFEGRFYLGLHKIDRSGTAYISHLNDDQMVKLAEFVAQL